MLDGSILTGTKKILGIDEDYTAFDFDVTTHINSAFATLTSLGVGPNTGFAIEDATAKWSDFLGTDEGLNFVQTYVYLKVRMYFDPPTTSYVLEAMQQQLNELEFRANIHADDLSWVSPFPVEDVHDDG